MSIKVDDRTIRERKWKRAGSCAEALGRMLWKLTIIVFLILILTRFNHMEAEHNSIIDRLDQVENTITEQIKESGAIEGAFPDSSFKSWMGFQVHNG